MRKTLITLTAICILLVPCMAFAELKIGVMDLEQIIYNSAPGQAAKQQMESKAAASRAELEQLQQQLQTLQEEIETQGMALSQEAQQSKRNEFRNLLAEYQQKAQALQDELKEEETRLFGPIIEVLEQVVLEYGDDNNFDLILNTKFGGVTYLNPELDITQDILELFDEAWSNR